MITLDSVRTALRDPQPWAAFDRLVRAEQAAGRKVRAIHDELLTLVEPVRQADNPPQDADDAMMDTLDALAGNCAREWRYNDPPTLPTEEEIAELPRWARVAFAVRSARRAAPLYLYFWPAAPVKHAAAVFNAIAESEAAASEAWPIVSARDADWPAGDAGDQAFSALLDRTGRAPTVRRREADNAARSAQAAARAATKSTLGESDSVLEAVFQADAAAEQIGFVSTSCIRRDFDRLADLARYFRWTDDTPVPPDVFGPLWPEGPPPGWPADPDVPLRAELPLTVVARDGVAPGVLVDEVVNLFNALNRYHIARTGRRLTRAGDVQTRLAVTVPAGAA